MRSLPWRPESKAARTALLWVFAGLSVTSACAGSSKGAKAPDDSANSAPTPWEDPRDLSQMKTLAVDGTFCDRRGKRADQVDTNHDNRADLITLYDPDGTITCKQADLNFDGRLDAFFHYAEGELRREQYDQDYDGRIDTGRYSKDGEVYLLEQDLNSDGYVDTWRRYDAERLVRIEHDRDADGRADMFVHYVGGKIDRVGYDVDGNGKVDQWDHDAARRAAIALESLARAKEPSAAEAEDAYVEPPPAGPASGAVSGTTGGEAEPDGEPEAKDKAKDGPDAERAGERESAAEGSKGGAAGQAPAAKPSDPSDAKAPAPQRAGE